MPSETSYNYMTNIPSSDNNNSNSNKSNFTANADIAFEEFCKKYFSNTDGKFMKKSTRRLATNPTKPPHVRDIFSFSTYNENSNNSNANNSTTPAASASTSTTTTTTTTPATSTNASNKYDLNKNLPEMDNYATIGRLDLSKLEPYYVNGTSQYFDFLNNSSSTKAAVAAATSTNNTASSTSNNNPTKSNKVRNYTSEFSLDYENYNLPDLSDIKFIKPETETSQTTSNNTNLNSIANNIGTSRYNISMNFDQLNKYPSINTNTIHNSTTQTSNGYVNTNHHNHQNNHNNHNNHHLYNNNNHNHNNYHQNINNYDSNHYNHNNNNNSNTYNHHHGYNNTSNSSYYNHHNNNNNVANTNNHHHHHNHNNYHHNGNHDNNYYNHHHNNYQSNKQHHHHNNNNNNNNHHYNHYNNHNGNQYNDYFNGNNNYHHHEKKAKHEQTKAETKHQQRVETPAKNLTNGYADIDSNTNSNANVNNNRFSYYSSNLNIFVPNRAETPKLATTPTPTPPVTPGRSATPKPDTYNGITAKVDINVNGLSPVITTNTVSSTPTTTTTTTTPTRSSTPKPETAAINGNLTNGVVEETPAPTPTPSKIAPKFRSEFLNRRQISYEKPEERIPTPSIPPAINMNGKLNAVDPNARTSSLKVVVCGMRKDGRLPIPKANFFMDKGNFGDDAGFWSENDTASAIGLADGATGNLMLGYDPGEFPRYLMKLCSNLFVEDKTLKDPKELLMRAFDILQDKTCYGSCTACVLTYDKETRNLSVANIGDSGYRLFRDGKIIRKSEPQRLSNDCPRQLDSYPWKAESRKLGVSYTDILCNDAVCDTVKIQKDDIIILSSDGLYDNIEDDEIEEIFNKSKSVMDAAEKLVIQAIRHYRKPDDILIIIGKVTENKPVSKHSIYSKESR